MIHFGDFFEIKTELFVLIVSFFAFLLQLLLCFKVRSKFVRMIPVALFLALALLFTVMIFIFTGWDSIGCLLFAIFFGCLLAVSGLGWGIWATVNFIKKKKHSQKSKYMR